MIVSFVLEYVVEAMKRSVVNMDEAGNAIAPEQAVKLVQSGLLGAARGTSTRTKSAAVRKEKIMWDEVLDGLKAMRQEFAAREAARVPVTEERLQEITAIIVNLIEPLPMRQRVPLGVELMGHCVSAADFDTLRDAILQRHPLQSWDLHRMLREAEQEEEDQDDDD
jgi:hypothetical protein